jgi:regulator of protease activity HflC (stomatin/prohibitin superfamily)
MSEGKLIVSGVVGVVAIALLLILNPFAQVGAGERGVVLEWGAFTGKVLEPGLHFVMPISQDVKTMDVQTQTISFDGDNSLSAASNDLQDVKIAVIANYHVNPDKVGEIYKQYGVSFEGNILSPIVREAVKSVSANYTAEQLVTKRAEFSDKVATILGEKLAERDVTLERLNIVNLNFSDSFNKAIEAKVTAEQDALAAKNKLQQVQFEADQRVAQAKGEAEAIKIQAEAITQQGGQAYVDLQAIKKWNGELPNTMLPGGAVPFINLTK